MPVFCGVVALFINYFQYNPRSNPNFKIHNSNRPVCIPDCEHAVFNPDGSVVAQPAKLYEYRPGMNAELTPVLIFEVLSKIPVPTILARTPRLERKWSFGNCFLYHIDFNRISCF